MDLFSNENENPIHNNNQSTMLVCRKRKIIHISSIDGELRPIKIASLDLIPTTNSFQQQHHHQNGYHELVNKNNYYAMNNDHIGNKNSQVRTTARSIKKNTSIKEHMKPMKRIAKPVHNHDNNNNDENKKREEQKKTPLCMPRLKILLSTDTERSNTSNATTTGVEADEIIASAGNHYTTIEPNKRNLPYPTPISPDSPLLFNLSSFQNNQLRNDFNDHVHKDQEDEGDQNTLFTLSNSSSSFSSPITDTNTNSTTITNQTAHSSVVTLVDRADEDTLCFSPLIKKSSSIHSMYPVVKLSKRKSKAVSKSPKKKTNDLRDTILFKQKIHRDTLSKSLNESKELPHYKRLTSLLDRQATYFFPRSNLHSSSNEQKVRTIPYKTMTHTPRAPMSMMVIPSYFAQAGNPYLYTTDNSSPSYSSSSSPVWKSQTKLSPQTWRNLKEFLSSLVNASCFHQETFYVSKYFAERYFDSYKTSMHINNLYTIMLTCCFIAAKILEEPYEPSMQFMIRSLSKISNLKLTTSSITRTEHRIVKALDWNLNPVTPYALLDELILLPTGMIFDLELFYALDLYIEYELKEPLFLIPPNALLDRFIHEKRFLLTKCKIDVSAALLISKYLEVSDFSA